MDIDESCDDGDMVDFDGCTNCTVDLLFNCELNATGTNSICEQVLLDLNVLDGSTLDYTNEYLDLDEHVFLSDPNSTNMTAFQTLNVSTEVHVCRSMYQHDCVCLYKSGSLHTHNSSPEGDMKLKFAPFCSS